MNIDPHEFESIIKKLYTNPNDQVLQYKRYNKLVMEYHETFPETDIHIFSTPGRTEVGGNHTDHNNGRVLAASVNLDSIAVAAANNNSTVTLYSKGYEKPFIVDLDSLDKVDNESGTTLALIRGIAARIHHLGFDIGGFNAYITSDVLPGSGLSSSASIEVLIGSIFNALFNNDEIAADVLAKIGQWAENNYFDKPCGLMDQTACAVGGFVTIDFQNPQKPGIEKVDFDFSAQNYSLIVVDTGGSHADLTDDYAAVPAEMKAAARELGVACCRETNLDALINNIAQMRNTVGDRAILRAFHFLQENERVVHQVQALKNGEFQKFLSLIRESGNSSYKWLQNVYTAKSPEQGVSLALALTEYFIGTIGEGACRVHGGGFSGTIQAFLPNTAVDKYIKLISGVFGHNSVYLLSIRPYGAVHLDNFVE